MLRGGRSNRRARQDLVDGAALPRARLRIAPRRSRARGARRGPRRVQLAGHLASPKSARTTAGAELFRRHCSGCHTLSRRRRRGLGDVRPGPAADPGPELRLPPARCVEDVLYAIRNGGFSGQIMPQNIVVGAEAAGGRAVPRRVRGHEGAEDPERRNPGRRSLEHRATGSPRRRQERGRDGARPPR